MIDLIYFRSSLHAVEVIASPFIFSSRIENISRWLLGISSHSTALRVPIPGSDLTSIPVPNLGSRARTALAVSENLADICASVFITRLELVATGAVDLWLTWIGD